LWRYHQERDGVISPQQVAMAEARVHGGHPAISRISADRPPPTPSWMLSPAARNVAPASRLQGGLGPPAQGVNARAELSRPSGAQAPTAQAPLHAPQTNSGISLQPGGLTVADPIGDLIQSCCHLPAPSDAGDRAAPTAAS
jgi:hypothetical protein